MKKIIIIFSIVFGILLISISAVLIYKNRKRNIIVRSIDKKTILELGKYRIKEMHHSCEDFVYGKNSCFSASVKSGEDFFNFIKESPYYDSTLCFKTEKEIYGYLIKDYNLFKYIITENEIEICVVTERVEENSDPNDFYYNYVMIDLKNLNVSENKCRWYGDLSFEKIKYICEKLGPNVSEVKENEIILNPLSVDRKFRGAKFKLYTNEKNEIKWEYLAYSYYENR